jgi:hypothetical protein
MGANFGRTSQRLSPRTIQAWYEQAATHASRLRTVALQILLDLEVADAAVMEWMESGH